MSGVGGPGDPRKTTEGVDKKGLLRRLGSSFFGLSARFKPASPVSPATSTSPPPSVEEINPEPLSPPSSPNALFGVKNVQLVEEDEDDNEPVSPPILGRKSLSRFQDPQLSQSSSFKWPSFRNLTVSPGSKKDLLSGDANDPNDTNRTSLRASLRNSFRSLSKRFGALLYKNVNVPEPTGDNEQYSQPSTSYTKVLVGDEAVKQSGIPPGVAKLLQDMYEEFGVIVSIRGIVIGGRQTQRYEGDFVGKGTGAHTKSEKGENPNCGHVSKDPEKYGKIRDLTDHLPNSFPIGVEPLKPNEPGLDELNVKYAAMIDSVIGEEIIGVREWNGRLCFAIERNEYRFASKSECAEIKSVLQDLQEGDKLPETITKDGKTYVIRSELVAGGDPKIKIIVVDQASLDHYAREEGITWPWPRTLYVPVLRYLKEAGAKETGKTRNSENKKRYFINGLIFCDFKSIAPIIC